MKVIIIGQVAEGKTVFARALQELCKRFGIEVNVKDPDFDREGKERSSIFAGPATLPIRLRALSEKGTKVDIITVQTNRHGRLVRDDERRLECEGLLQLVRDDIERDHVLPPGGWDKK